MQGSLLFSVFALLTVAQGLVFLAQRFKVPTLLAYLIVGMALGPHGFGLLANTEEVASLAEFGVVFLMFSIGLEFSINRLVSMKATVFGLGGSQVALTAACATAVAVFAYGQHWQTGMVIGLAAAMSSTAIVARMLSERFELHSRSGRQTMGVLLFQDIAVVPSLILVPALAPYGDAEVSLAKLGVQLLATAGVAGLLLWGKRPMQALLNTVAKQRSEELFVLTTLWVVLALSLATHAAGLSMALGAFIGGMLISETKFRHQVEAEVRPFRDILLGLFFVTMGMMLNVGFVVSHLPELFLAVVLLMGGKAFIVMCITKAARTPLHASYRTTAQLAQGGEFGLVLIQLAFAHKLVDSTVFQLTLSAILVSMFIAPFLIGWVADKAAEIARNAPQLAEAPVARAEDHVDHVILCGYGRMGRQIGRMLAEENIPYVALDQDLAATTHAAPGGSVIFGNAARSEFLKAAGLLTCRVVVVAYRNEHSAERVIHQVRQEREDVPIIVRTADDSSVEMLKAAGATEVIPELLEGGLVVAAEALVQCGVPVESAMAKVRSIRTQRYATLKQFYESE